MLWKKNQQTVVSSLSSVCIVNFCQIPLLLFIVKVYLNLLIRCSTGLKINAQSFKENIAETCIVTCKI